MFSTHLRTRSDDAENRIVKVGTTIEYKYDGDGNRVLKVVGSDRRTYFRNAATGEVYQEFVNGALDRNHHYFAGERWGTWLASDGFNHVNFNDHLGSPRVRTYSWGGNPEFRTDYFPFGGEVNPSASSQNYKFTGQERDAETGLDYFIARHYGSNIGRFLQPDEFQGGPVDAFSSNDPLQGGPLPYASITDPRSLNKYGYTYNNPLRYTDQNGHCPAAGVICLGVPAAVVALGKAILYTGGIVGAYLLADAAADVLLAEDAADTPDSLLPPPLSDVPRPDNVTPDTDDEDSGGSSGSTDIQRTGSEKASDLDSAIDTVEQLENNQRVRRKSKQKGESNKAKEVRSKKKSERRVKNKLREMEGPVKKEDKP